MRGRRPTVTDHSDGHHLQGHITVALACPIPTRRFGAVQIEDELLVRRAMTMMTMMVMLHGSLLYAASCIMIQQTRNMYTRAIARVLIFERQETLCFFLVSRHGGVQEYCKVM
jgi:hypothetical protein